MIRLFLTVLFSLGFAVGSVFRVEVAQTEDNGIVALANNNAVTQTVDGYWGIYQMANITIGTPPQPVVVRMDTGSPSVWVTDVSCTGENGECRPTMTTYDSSKSSTFIDEGKPFKWDKAGTCTGTLGTETIILGDRSDNQLVVKDVEFARVTYIKLGAFPKVAGSVGLSQESPFLKAARAQGLLSEPIFTVWLKEIPPSEGNVPTGLITYGAVDNEHCEADITYVPLDTETCFWYCMKLEKVSLGSFSADGDGGWFARSDTGNSLITGPKSATDEIAKTAGWTGKTNPNNDYIVDCNAQVDPLVFHIDGKEFAVEQKHLLGYAPSDPNACRLRIRGNPGADTWGLGQPFIRQYCHVHDFEDNKLGLAKPRE